MVCLDLAVEDKAVISPPRSGRSTDLGSITAKYARRKISIKTGWRLKNWIECNSVRAAWIYSVVKPSTRSWTRSAGARWRRYKYWSGPQEAHCPAALCIIDIAAYAELWWVLSRQYATFGGGYNNYLQYFISISNNNIKFSSF